MRIIPLKKSDKVYSCNSYLVLGDWNRIGEPNILIDPGTDGFVLDEIQRISTGVGKVPVEQVILTHNHFDHAGGVQAIKERYNARVLAFADGPLIDELVTDGQLVKAGEGFLEVLHMPGHSSDSICLYDQSAQVLFSGDTHLLSKTPGGVYLPGYADILRKIAGRRILTVYSGHDHSVTESQKLMQHALQGAERNDISILNSGG